MNNIYEIIQKEHEHIKSLLTPYITNKVIVLFDGSDSRFDTINNTIIISFPTDFDVDEFENKSDNWQIWKIELVHEMVHEYQYIVKPEISEEGLKLFSLNQITPCKPKPNSFGFYGKDHNEVFYTVVDLFAKAFNTNSIDLLTNPRRRI